MQRQFIRVAQAKGLGEWRVAFRHAAPNAILPVITFVGISIGQFTGGAVVTETIFSMPGTGRLFVASIEARDFPVMLAIGMLIVVGVVLMNLLADIGYAIANPQIRHDVVMRPGRWFGAGLVAFIATVVIAAPCSRHRIRTRRASTCWPCRVRALARHRRSGPRRAEPGHLWRAGLVAIGLGAALVAMAIGVPLDWWPAICAAGSTSCWSR